MDALVVLIATGLACVCSWEAGSRYGWRKFLDADEKRWRDLTQGATRLNPEFRRNDWAKRVAQNQARRRQFNKRGQSR